MRWLFSGGAPFTPYDVATSSLISVWDITGMGILDYNRLNTERASAFHQLDIRVDKRWFFEKWSLNLYIDIQNLYGFAAETPPFLTTILGQDGNPLVDPNDPSRYQLNTLENSSGTIVPTLGVIVEF